MMFVKTITLAALLATSAYAQGTDTTTSPTPSPTLSPCLLDCLNSADQCVFTDPTCVCVNTDFQTTVAQCLQANCTADDLAAAAALQESVCGASSSISSGLSSLSSVISSVSSSVSSRVSSLSNTNTRTSSTGTNTRTSTSGTGTPTGSGGGAPASHSVSFLATGGAILLGVIGGGLLVF